MKSNLLIPCLMVLCVACQKQTESAGKIRSEGTVLIQFKNPPQLDNYFYYTSTAWLRKDALITVFNNDPIEETSYELKTDSLPETIKVNTFSDFILFRHYTTFLDYKDYLFSKGDSVEISYQGNNPIISIKNRKVKLDDYRVEDLFRKGLQEPSPMAKFENAQDLYARELFNDPKSMAENRKLTPKTLVDKRDNNISRIKKELFYAHSNYIKTNNRLLDSLFQENRLSEAVYHFYKDKLSLKNIQAEVETDKLTEKKVQDFLSAQNQNPFTYPEIHRQELIKAVRDKFILPVAAYRNLKDGRNRDSREVFDKVASSAIFPEKDKVYLLTREINRIAQLHPKEEFLTYFAKYENIVKDTAQVRFVKEDFAGLLNKEAPDNKSLTLIDQQKNKIKLEDLLRKHKGKVLYLDFWASWCGPCRAAFPASRKLREKLKDQVVFVYLSIDDTAKPWAQATTKEKLDAYPDNYLVANWEASEFIKTHKINAIPRYMIFDRKGSLVYANAPGVENQDAEDLLKKLAK